MLYRELLLKVINLVAHALDFPGQAENSETWYREIFALIMNSPQDEQLWCRYYHWLGQDLRHEFDPACAAAVRATSKIEYIRRKAGWRELASLVTLLDGPSQDPAMVELRQALEAAKKHAGSSIRSAMGGLYFRNPHDPEWTRGCWPGVAQMLPQVLGGDSLAPWTVPHGPTGPEYLYKSAGVLPVWYIYARWPFEKVYRGPPQEMQGLGPSCSIRDAPHMGIERVPARTLRIIARDKSWTLDGSFDPKVLSAFRRKHSKAVRLTRLNVQDFNIVEDGPVMRITLKSTA